MTKSGRHPKVDAFLKKAKQWREEMEQLRKQLLGCELTEDFKWGKPCYTVDGRPVVIFLPLKAFCGLLFFRGALLSDPKGILVKSGPNAEVGRQIRFTHLEEIVAKESLVKQYVQNAIAVAKAGLEVPVKKVSELKIPEELSRQLKQSPELKTAFNALTPGRQKGYIFFISGAKQSKTREARVEKCRPRILAGKGLLDR